MEEFSVQQRSKRMKRWCIRNQKPVGAQKILSVNGVVRAIYTGLCAKDSGPGRINERIEQR